MTTLQSAEVEKKPAKDAATTQTAGSLHKHGPVADDPKTPEIETAAPEKGMIETPEMQDAAKVTETPVTARVPQAMQDLIDKQPIDALDAAVSALRKQAESYRLLNTHDLVGIANTIVAAVRATSAKPDKLDKPK